MIFVIDNQTNSGTSAEMVAIDAESHEVARTLAFEGSLACNRKVELRPLL
jgi:hypothetical protein